MTEQTKKKPHILAKWGHAMKWWRANGKPDIGTCRPVEDRPDVRSYFGPMGVAHRYESGIIKVWDHYDPYTEVEGRYAHDLGTAILWIVEGLPPALPQTDDENGFFA